MSCHRLQLMQIRKRDSKAYTAQTGIKQDPKERGRFLTFATNAKQSW